MRVDLPNGQWVEVREKLGAGDRWAISSGYTVTYKDGGTILPGNVGALQMKAFLASVITDWSFPGVPVPSQNMAGAEVLAHVFAEDLEGYTVLEEAVAPLFAKVVASRPNPPGAATTPSSS